MPPLKTSQRLPKHISDDAKVGTLCMEYFLGKIIIISKIILTSNLFGVPWNISASAVHYEEYTNFDGNWL